MKKLLAATSLFAATEAAWNIYNPIYKSTYNVAYAEYKNPTIGVYVDPLKHVKKDRGRGSYTAPKEDKYTWRERRQDRKAAKAAAKAAEEEAERKANEPPEVEPVVVETV